MPIYQPTPRQARRGMATMQPYRPANPPMSRQQPASQIANPPSAASLAQGPGDALTVTWTAPEIDGTHDAATAFNLRFSPSGAATWTMASGITSPYVLTGLSAATAIDVQMQSVNAAGASEWSAISTLTTAAAAGPFAPVITGVAPPPDGTATKLSVAWSPPTIDSTHGAATGFDLRFSPAGANAWTTMTGATSPCTLTGLGGATAIDVEVRGASQAAGPGAWSATITGTTWGSAVASGDLTVADSQVHNTNIAPGGGANMTAAAVPTLVTGAAFAWSASNSTVPTSDLITAAGDGQPNGWGQYFGAPATAGTFYLWMLAQGAGGVTTGALVSSAITVT